VAGCCEWGDEPLNFIKCGEFLTSCGNFGFSRRTSLCGASWLVVCLVGWLFGKVKVAETVLHSLV
jgi:hypothetical protein